MLPTHLSSIAAEHEKTAPSHCKVGGAVCYVEKEVARTGTSAAERN